MIKLEKNIQLKIILLLLVLPVSYMFCLAVGEIDIPFNEIIRAAFFMEVKKGTSEIILTDFRIPEALTAIVCSGALAISGLVMQSYFRNPLAGPSVMGVSSGASFGIALLLICFPQFLTGTVGAKLMMVLFATVGAVLVLFLLSLIQFRLKNIETLLIVGLLISYFLSSCETMLLSNTNAQNIKTFVHWGFGSFSKTGYIDISVITLICLGLILITLFLSKALDAFQFSDETISNTGINKFGSGRAMLIISGLLCAVVTGYCGPIAFIGLCVPHIARMFLKTTRHFYLILGNILIAAHIGLICVAFSRLTLFGQNLPLNSITSFLGAPFIIYILLKSRKKKIA
jgi:iron complex transport system permease protein